MRDNRLPLLCSILLLATGIPHSALVSEGHPGSPQSPKYRVHTRIGFHSERILAQQFKQYGRGFGRITEREYLLMAQDLRDRPIDMQILEAVRRDGLISRYDRRTRGFILFERNLVIRTFFRPPDGEKYFHRQLRSSRRR